MKQRLGGGNICSDEHLHTGLFPLLLMSFLHSFLLENPFFPNHCIFAFPCSSHCNSIYIFNVLFVFYEHFNAIVLCSHKSVQKLLKSDFGKLRKSMAWFISDRCLQSWYVSPLNMFAKNFMASLIFGGCYFFANVIPIFPYILANGQ